ncbi:dihydrofolate reductase [Candidatus Pacearchaeota archaeon]|nr:dihydrofolate reductase [Candidatus Pacearchaeota archaeon]
MKIILYMAMSLNGMIAKTNDNTSWITPEEWNSYSSTVRKAGALIVGRRTYNILTKQPEFKEFKNVKLVVVSKKQNPELVNDSHLIAESPEKALELLKDFKEIIVAGGGILDNSFIEKNLVDEVYIDIEPIILTKGIPLFAGEKIIEINLKLIGQKKISENEIQLHYKIIK